MDKRKAYKSLIYTDIATIGLFVVLLAADAYSLGKLVRATEDDPSRSTVSTDEAPTPEPDSESGE